MFSDMYECDCPHRDDCSRKQVLEKMRNKFEFDMTKVFQTQPLVLTDFEIFQPGLDRLRNLSEEIDREILGLNDGPVEEGG